MVSQNTFLFCSLVTLDDLTLSLDSLSDPSNVTISLSHETQLFVTLLKLLIFLLLIIVNLNMYIFWKNIGFRKFQDVV